jgi:hypothetical protein
MSVTLVGIIAVGLLIARCGNEATRCSGGAAHRHGLGTCHSKGAAVVVEEDATTMTKFFPVRFIAKQSNQLVCVVCLLKEQRHWPLQNQTRGSRLGSLL